MKPKIVAIIQARMTSSRLYGKVLADIAGEPMLSHVLHRVQRARGVDQAIIATSSDSSDDPIETFCATRGIYCFRGSLEDVLDRYYNAARSCSAKAVVRITADCPLIDPDVIDQVLSVFSSGNYDYVSNTIRCTYPD